MVEALSVVPLLVPSCAGEQYYPLNLSVVRGRMTDCPHLPRDSTCYPPEDRKNTCWLLTSISIENDWIRLDSILKLISFIISVRTRTDE